MRTTEAVVVLVEVHDLETVELIGNLLNPFFLAFFAGFDTGIIPRSTCQSVPVESGCERDGATNHLMYVPGAGLFSPLALAVPLAFSPL